MSDTAIVTLISVVCFTGGLFLGWWFGLEVM